MTTSQPTQSALDLNRKSKWTNWELGDAVAWLAPMILVLIVLLFSPNFDSTTRVRNSPLGSDFLQDWVGAKIISSSERHLLYDTGYAQSLQHDPSVVGFSWPNSNYYPMVYPPFLYSMLRPLAALPYRAALWCWMLLIAAGLGATIALIKCFEPARKFWPAFLVAALLYAPLLMSINMAHKSVFLLLIFAATFIHLQRQKHFTAGIIFGLLAFKPHLAILLATVMLVKRQWSFVFGAATTASILMIATLACGADLCWDYFQQILAANAYTENAGYRLHEAVNLNAVSQLLIGESNWATNVITGLTSITVVAAVALAWRGPIQTNSNRFAIQFSILMFAIPLLSPHFYIYDLTIMLLPFLLFFVVKFARTNNWSLPDSRSKGVDSITFYAIAIFFIASGSFATLAAASGIQFGAVLLMTLIGTSLVHLYSDITRADALGPMGTATTSSVNSLDAL